MFKRNWSFPASAAVFFLILGCFLAGTLISEDQPISKSERRRLALRPSFQLSQALSGQWQSEIDRWSADQLFARDALLNLRSLSTSWLYGNLDDRGLISKDGSLIQVETEIHEDSLAHAAKVFSSIYENNLKGTDCRIYLSIIPDKSYFLEKGEYLNMDYAAFFEKVRDDLFFAKDIPIEQTLQLDDYYYTDPHWRQESILDAARTLAEGLGVQIPDAWTQKQALERFEGQSGPLTALPSKADSLNYLWTPSMEDWTVWRYVSASPDRIDVYDLDAANSLDPYHLFLSGQAGMIEIDNPHGPKGRELIVFSDSFGSSMVPLLASGYEKTVLIDLRSLPSWRLNSLIDFDSQDVLFLYSTSVLNASDALK